MRTFKRQLAWCGVYSPSLTACSLFVERFLLNFGDGEGVLIFAARGHLSAAEITLVAHGGLSRAIYFVLVILADLGKIVFVPLGHICKIFLREESFDLFVNFARLYLKEQLRQLVHFC